MPFHHRPIYFFKDRAGMPVLLMPLPYPLLLVKRFLLLPLSQKNLVFSTMFSFQILFEGPERFPSSISMPPSFSRPVFIYPAVIDVHEVKPPCTQIPNQYSFMLFVVLDTAMFYSLWYNEPENLCSLKDRNEKNDV